MLLVVAVLIFIFSKLIIVLIYWMDYNRKTSGISGIFVPHVFPQMMLTLFDLLYEILLAVGSFE